MTDAPQGAPDQATACIFVEPDHEAAARALNGARVPNVAPDRGGWEQDYEPWLPPAEQDAAPHATEPTYPNHAVPIDEARAAVRDAIVAHLAAGHGCRAIRVSTGVGKTRIAAEAIAADVLRRRLEDDHRAMLYAVPTHKLGGEVEKLFAEHGVTARVYRGRKAPDPDAADVAGSMCLDLESVAIAQDLGEPVSTSCCRGKHPVTADPVTCPLFYECSYQAQLRAAPDVWIVPHQILFHAQAALGEVAGVFIDEGFWQAGLSMGGKGLTLDEVGAAPALRGSRLDSIADVAAYRGELARAFRRQQGSGGVERRHLAAEGLDADRCAEAHKAEWRLKDAAEIWPGMGDVERRRAADAAGAALRVRVYAAIWKAAIELAAEPDRDAKSGRLLLADVETEHGTARCVRVNRLRPIVQSWADAPTFIMDATLPDIAVLRRLYPDVEIAAEVEAQAPHSVVRQVIGAPVSAGKLMGSAAGRNREEVRRAIVHRFVEVGRCRTLVIAQKLVAEWLAKTNLPAGIEVAHFNAIAGLDGFKDVGLLIVIGRTLPNVLAVEAMAGAVTGVQAVVTAEPEVGPRWYDKTALGIRMADGTGHAIQGDRHPDPVAEAIRWEAAEAEVLQAIGRARAVNRTASDPVAIDLWNDLVLPLTVREVLTWNDVESGHDAAMLADGIVLEGAADMAKCWPEVWGTLKAAERWRAKFTSPPIPIRITNPPNPIKDILYRNRGVSSFRYRHVRERQKWRRGWHDRAVCPDPKAWIEARLDHPLADFEFLPTGRTA